MKLVIEGSTVDRARLGRRSRVKGKVWEREVAQALRPVFGPEAKRGFQSRSGRDGCDVEGTPFWVECKHGQQVNVRAAMKQALDDTDGRPPVVVAKDNNRVPVVMMRMSDWLALVQRAYGVAPVVDDHAEQAGPRLAVTEVA